MNGPQKRYRDNDGNDGAITPRIETGMYPVMEALGKLVHRNTASHNQELIYELFKILDGVEFNLMTSRQLENNKTRTTNVIDRLSTTIDKYRTRIREFNLSIDRVRQFRAEWTDASDYRRNHTGQDFVSMMRNLITQKVAIMKSIQTVADQCIEFVEKKKKQKASLQDHLSISHRDVSDCIRKKLPIKFFTPKRDGTIIIIMAVPHDALDTETHTSPSKKHKPDVDNVDDTLKFLAPLQTLVDNYQRIIDNSDPYHGLFDAWVSLMTRITDMRTDFKTLIDDGGMWGELLGITGSKNASLCKAIGQDIHILMGFIERNALPAWVTRDPFPDDPATCIRLLDIGHDERSYKHDSVCMEFDYELGTSTTREDISTFRHCGDTTFVTTLFPDTPKEVWSRIYEDAIDDTFTLCTLVDARTHEVRRILSVYRDMSMDLGLQKYDIVPVHSDVFKITPVHYLVVTTHHIDVSRLTTDHYLASVLLSPNEPTFAADGRIAYGGTISTCINMGRDTPTLFSVDGDDDKHPSPLYEDIINMCLSAYSSRGFDTLSLRSIRNSHYPHITSYHRSVILMGITPLSWIANCLHASQQAVPMIRERMGRLRQTFVVKWPHVDHIVFASFRQFESIARPKTNSSTTTITCSMHSTAADTIIRTPTVLPAETDADDDDDSDDGYESGDEGSISFMEEETANIPDTYTAVPMNKFGTSRESIDHANIMYTSSLLNPKTGICLRSSFNSDLHDRITIPENGSTCRGVVSTLTDTDTYTSFSWDITLTAPTAASVIERVLSSDTVYGSDNLLSATLAASVHESVNPVVISRYITYDGLLDSQHISGGCINRYTNTVHIIGVLRLLVRMLEHNSMALDELPVNFLSHCVGSDARDAFLFDSTNAWLSNAMDGTVSDAIRARGIPDTPVAYVLRSICRQVRAICAVKYPLLPRTTTCINDGDIEFYKLFGNVRENATKSHSGLSFLRLILNSKTLLLNRYGILSRSILWIDVAKRFHTTMNDVTSASNGASSSMQITIPHQFADGRTEWPDHEEALLHMDRLHDVITGVGAHLHAQRAASDSKETPFLNYKFRINYTTALDTTAEAADNNLRLVGASSGNGVYRTVINGILAAANYMFTHMTNGRMINPRNANAWTPIQALGFFSIYLHAVIKGCENADSTMGIVQTQFPKIKASLHDLLYDTVIQLKRESGILSGTPCLDCEEDGETVVQRPLEDHTFWAYVDAPHVTTRYMEMTVEASILRSVHAGTRVATDAYGSSYAFAELLAPAYKKMISSIPPYLCHRIFCASPPAQTAEGLWNILDLGHYKSSRPSMYNILRSWVLSLDASTIAKFCFFSTGSRIYSHRKISVRIKSPESGSYMDLPTSMTCSRTILIIDYSCARTTQEELRDPTFSALVKHVDTMMRYAFANGAMLLS